MVEGRRPVEGKASSDACPRTQCRNRHVPEAASLRIGGVWAAQAPNFDRVRPSTGARCGNPAPYRDKLKALLRKMALRSIEALWKALGSITGCVSPQECKNFVRHAGYFRSG